MISDPLTIEAGATDLTAPRVVSPSASTGRFRHEAADGSEYIFDFIQNGNTSRSRHVVRFLHYRAPVAGVRQSVTFTLTIDEPAEGTISNTDMLFIWNTFFKGTLNDTVIGKLLNGEI